MLGNKIKETMKLKKITSTELAEQVGVSATHISYILNNKRDPSVELLNKISTALNVPPNYLFENEDTNNMDTNIHDSMVDELIQNFKKLSFDKQLIVKELVKSMVN